MKKISQETQIEKIFQIETIESFHFLSLIAKRCKSDPQKEINK